ncbi:HNH endonuclease [Streptomyces sp. NPDC055078]
MVNRPTVEVRHRRRVQLSKLFRNRCAYCRRRFHSNRPLTIDHIAPLSLFATWSVGHLAPACRDCNSRKGNRLPLSLALLILQSAHPTAPASTPAVHPAGPVFTGPAGWAGWLALARLAHTAESAHHPPDPAGERSTPDLRDDPRHSRLESAPYGQEAAA